MSVLAHLVHAICLALVRSPLGHGRGKILKHGNSAVPVNACVCYRDTLLEATGTLRWDLLVAFVDIGLYHYADNARLAFADLVTDALGHKGLVAVVLVRIA